MNDFAIYLFVIPHDCVCVLQEELVELEKSLQAEQSSLRGQQQQQQRSAATVTGQMCQESQVRTLTHG